jgi:hypothetical protein
MRETKELWLESLLLGALDLLPPFSDEIRFHSPDSPLPSSTEAIRTIQKLIEQLKDKKLFNIWEQKPLVDVYFSS